MTPEELAMICRREDAPGHPSLLEPLAGPLPVAEGGEILEPLSVPMPAPGASPESESAARRSGGTASGTREGSTALPLVMKSFWRFGAETPPPHRGRVMDWDDPR